MAYQDKGGYKNPQIPKPRDAEGAPPAGLSSPVAPSRGNGLMGRAAAARVRQTKPGQPPIPSPPVVQQQEQRQKLAPVVDPGQRKDDIERERIRLGQQTEQRKRAEEQRKRADSNYRLQALQGLAGKGSTMAAQGLSTPAAGVGMEYNPMAAQAPASPYAYQMEGAEKPTSTSPQAGPSPFSPSDEEEKKKQESSYAQIAEKLKEQGWTEQEDGTLAPPSESQRLPDDSERSPEEWGKKAGTVQEKNFYNKEGELVGYYKDGKFYHKSGKGWTEGNEGWANMYESLVQSGEFTESGEVTSGDLAAKGMVHQAVDKMSSWLEKQTGIPEEQLKGQIAQVHMQSADQIAKFANMMAARGVGSGGLMAAGMGQIASQTVAAISNIRFENEKLKIEEQLNKMKTMAAMAGQFLSEENRMEIFEKMNALEQRKQAWLEKQDTISNTWADLNDYIALLGGDGWHHETLAWVTKQIDNGVPHWEIAKYIRVMDGNKIGWFNPDNPQDPNQHFDLF